MQRSHIAVGALVLVFTVSCKSETSAEGEGEAKVQAEAEMNAEVTAQADVQPRIGGTVVAAGDYRVEILAYITGRIEAVVMDAKGELVLDPGEVDLVANFAADGDARAEVGLEWDPTEARFSGQVDANVQLVPGPVEVKFEVAGQAHAGQLAQLGLAVEGTHGGQIMVAGNYAVEIVADGEFVHAYVFDASGEAHAKGEFDLDLQVGAGTELALVWDPPSASYKAKVEGDFDLEAKPVVLEITVEGIVSVAAVQSFSAKASADAVADLDVDAVANVDASARVAAPKVSARAEASKSGSAKATADVDKSASAEGSAKTGSSGAKASGSAKAGFKFGVGN